ncbi:Pentatricopeptide repeat-containing protein [Galdieria sulphuraria]|nr:Pentatricopeptide repeat-containing protein [Galdieria sulphuraria]
MKNLSTKLTACFLASTCKKDFPVLYSQRKTQLKLCCPRLCAKTGLFGCGHFSLLPGKAIRLAIDERYPTYLYFVKELYHRTNMSLKLRNFEAQINISQRRDGKRNSGRLFVLSDQIYEFVKEVIRKENFVFEEKGTLKELRGTQVSQSISSVKESVWKLEQLFTLGRLQELSREDAQFLLREAASRGDTNTVLCIISKLEELPTKPDYPEYNFLIVSLLVERDLEDGNRVHSLIDSCFRLVNDCAVPDILQVVEDIYAVGGRATTQTWNRIIGVVGKRDLEQVLSVYRKMLSLDRRALSQTTFNLLISIFKYSQSWNKSAAWVGAMFYNGLKPDAYTCNNLLDVCLYVREYFRAKSIIAFMKRHQIAPDICTYTQLLRLSGRTRLFDDVGVNTTYTEISSSKAIRHIWKLVHSKLNPDLTFYNALIDAFVRMGDIHSAQEAFDSLASHSLEPDVISYNSLMHGYARNGDLSSCLTLMQKMREAGVRMDERTYCIGIVACKNAGDPDHAMKIYFDAYENGRAQGEVLHHAVYTACGPKFENARRIWKAMTAVYQPGFASYKGFLGCCGAAGRIDIALDTVREMKQRGIMPTRELFVAFLNASKRYKKLYKGIESRYYNMLRQECGIILL